MFKTSIDDRMDLRLLETRHAEEFLELVKANRAHIRQWVRTPARIESLADSQTYITQNLELFVRNEGLMTGIWHEGRLVGELSLLRMSLRDRCTEMAYWLAEDAQGQGLMTKACRALVTYAFEELNLNRVEIRCAKENQQSMAIPKRLGFQEEGTLRQAQWLYDRFVDHVVFAMIAEDWKSVATSNG